MAQETTNGEIIIEIENIGGISKSKAELADGVNVLSGPNATNRTSFLKALAAAQGSRNVSIKSDKTEAEIQFEINGERYHRRIIDTGDSLSIEGEYPIDENDIELAELFAFLFEQNRSRQAIRQGDDLREVVMTPVDTTNIENEIKTLQSERSQKEAELADLRSLKQDLPDLKQRRNEITEQIGELEDELTAKQSQADEVENTVGEIKTQKERIESKITDLRNKESKLEKINSRIDSTKNTISHITADLEEAESELDDLSTVDSTEIEDVESELTRLHDSLAQKETMMGELQNIIQFNKDIIFEDDSQAESLSVLSKMQTAVNSDTDTTDQLIEDDEITCWTCGTSTSRSTIASTVERLQAVHEDLYGEREQLRQRISEYESRKRELEQAIERRKELEETITELNSKLDRNKQTLATLEENKLELTEQVSELERKVDSLRDQREDTVLDLHQEINNLEIDLREATNERDSIIKEISSIEEEIKSIDNVETEIEQLNSQIEELRQRVDRIEQQTVESFNEHMNAVLGQLKYSNIERIWIERQVKTAQSGQRRAEEVNFELHIIREAEDGSSYEDTLENLSESEREVTGLIFALAGYVAHNVYEKVPFMILDSLEAIDSDRIARLIEYLREHTANIAVALLDEDASALDSDYTTVSLAE